MPHTPGPWRYYSLPGDCKGKYPKQCKSFTIESNSRKHMFDTQAWVYEDDMHVWQEVEDNARLIAAAPELLEALEHLVHYARKLEEASGLAFRNNTLEKYSTLITKAKGE